MNRLLVVVILAVVPGACVQMQASNAQVFADRAARIAQSCPAAADAAARSQAAANAAQEAAGNMADATASEEKARAGVEYWDQQVAQLAERAELERQEAERLRGERTSTIAAWEAAASTCRTAASCAGGIVIPKVDIICDQRDRDMRICGCSDRQSCESAADRAEALLAAGPSDLNRRIDAADEAARDAEERRKAAEAEASKAREAARVAHNAVNSSANSVRDQEKNAQDALIAAAEACDVALENSSQPPPPVGGFQQDVFGSQNRGLSGACSPGMQASCLAIQVQCNASCTANHLSCSPGAPAGCLACFAAGCI